MENKSGKKGNSQTGQQEETGQSIIEVPLDSIEVDERFNRGQGSYEDPNIVALAKSMKENGQLIPVILKALPKNRFKNIDGSRRCTAARLNGWSTIKAVVREDADAVVDALSIDGGSQKFNILNKLLYVKQFLDENPNLKGKQQRKVLLAKSGLPKSTLSNILRVLEQKKWFELIRDKGLSFSVAKAAVGLQEQNQAKILEMIGGYYKAEECYPPVNKVLEEIKTLKKQEKSG